MFKGHHATKDIIITALFAATLTAGKLALMAVPNIEIVTLFIMLYTVTFGLKISFPATIVFCFTEGLIFGFNTWLIAYLIHWPLVVLVTFLISKIKYQNYIIYIVIGALLTALFGVISSAIDAVISSSIAKINFFVMFSVIYMRGIVFYATHIVSNAIFIAIAFPILKTLLLNAKKLYYKDNKN